MGSSRHVCRRTGRRNTQMRKIAILGVLTLMALALAAVPAVAVGPTSVTQTGGLHFVGTPDVTATKTATSAFLTATGEVAGAGTTATATLAADAEVTTGCINRGSKDQQPSGLQRTTTTTSGTTTFRTRSGRGTFSVSTVPITTNRTCPDQMVPVLVGVNFTNVTLTITSGPKTLTATFPDIDP
jgi:hypothetical protein